MEAGSEGDGPVHSPVLDSTVERLSGCLQCGSDAEGRVRGKHATYERVPAARPTMPPAPLHDDASASAQCLCARQPACMHACKPARRAAPPASPRACIAVPSPLLAPKQPCCLPGTLPACGHAAAAAHAATSPRPAPAPQLREDVDEAMAWVNVVNNPVEDNQALAQRLGQLGHDVRVRTALGGGEGFSCLRNLRHVFLTVALQGGRTLRCTAACTLHCSSTFAGRGRAALSLPSACSCAVLCAPTCPPRACTHTHAHALLHTPQAARTSWTWASASSLASPSPRRATPRCWTACRRCWWWRRATWRPWWVRARAWVCVHAAWARWLQPRARWQRAGSTHWQRTCRAAHTIPWHAARAES